MTTEEEALGAKDAPQERTNLSVDPDSILALFDKRTQVKATLMQGASEMIDVYLTTVRETAFEETFTDLELLQLFQLVLDRAKLRAEIGEAGAGK